MVLGGCSWVVLQRPEWLLPADYCCQFVLPGAGAPPVKCPTESRHSPDPSPGPMRRRRPNPKAEPRMLVSLQAASKPLPEQKAGLRVLRSPGDVAS